MSYLEKELNKLIEEKGTIFDFLQNTAVDGLWFLDLERPDNVWFSAKFWKTLGFDPADRPDRSVSWKEHMLEDDLESAKENLARHCDDPEYPYDQLIRYRHRDGSTIMMRSTGMALHDEKGKPVRMLGVHVAIPEKLNLAPGKEQPGMELPEKQQPGKQQPAGPREEGNNWHAGKQQPGKQEPGKQQPAGPDEAERKLRESEERFRQIAETNQSVIWELQVDGLFTYVSPMAEQVWGYRPEELEGKINYFELHPEQGREEFRRKTLELAEKMTIFRDFLNPIQKKDGSIVWVLSSGRPVLNEHGQLVGYRGSDQDVTGKLEAEKKAKSTHDLLVKLAKQVPGVVYQYRLYPDGRSCFPYASPGMMSIYGYTPEEVREDATPVFRRLHPDDIDRVKEEIEKSARDLSLFHLEFRVVMPGKGVQWRACDARPEKLDDGSTLWHGVITDSTESVEHLEKVKSLLNMQEEQNRRLTGFAHIVSHNLRTHTANMQGLLSLVEAEEPELYEGHYLQLIRISSEQLNETINHLNEVLDITKESKENRVNMEVHRIVASVAQKLSLLARKEGVEIIQQVPERRFIRMVPGYFERIVLNLFTNAITFRSKKRDSWLRISLAEEHPYSVIIFEDNGIGMDLGDEGAGSIGMYKTFHARENSRGLGLFITKSHTEAMGGKMEVTSKPDEGSTIKIYLPDESS